MYSYPFYLLFISVIKTQFAILSRIRSVVLAPNSEICAANKVLSIKMILTTMQDDLTTVENLIIQQEFTHCEAEVLDTQENLSCLGLKFTLNLN
jgi:hypothetical protein